MTYCKSSYTGLWDYIGLIARVLTQDYGITYDLLQEYLHRIMGLHMTYCKSTYTGLWDYIFKS